MWLYKNTEVNTLEDMPPKTIGFIYKITCISTGKWYIGRKLIDKAAYKTVKGVKKKIRKESDWADYYSSSPALVAEIEVNGKDKYKREILIYVTTKACLTFGEEYMLFTSGSLFDPLCYNGNIRSRIQRSWFNKTPDFFKELQGVKL